MPSSSLQFVPLEPPNPGEIVNVASGIRWVRMPLPFRLDHINIWLIDGADGCTIVDAGVADDRTKGLWQKVLEVLPPDVAVNRVLITHHHPDHCGLAGWLAALYGAPVAMSRNEWLSAQFYLREDKISLDATHDFYRRAGGEPAGYEDGSVPFASYLSGFPAAYLRLADGGLLGAPHESAWRIMTFGGHAPELICLHNPALSILVAGDQVLPQISPIIGILPHEPEDNPLGEYLDSLERLMELPADTLVLPSHGQPFIGLHRRLADLITHHRDRLDTLLSSFDGNHTAATLTARLFPKVGPGFHQSFALSETLAHVRYLEIAGKVRRSSKAGVDYFRRDEPLSAMGIGK